MTSTTQTRSITKADLDNGISLAFQPATLDHSFNRLMSAHMVCLAIWMIEHNVSARRISESCSRKHIPAEDTNLLLHLITVPVETLKTFVPAGWFN